MPKSAVVDASVLVSVFLFPESVPGRVVKLARQGKYVLHLSPLLLNETRYALLSTRLRAIHGCSDEAVLAWCTELQKLGRLFTAPLPEIGPVCRDPNDDHVIATALALNADVIVTGDKDLLALSQYRSIRILTARAFLAELGG
jgi:uncharacterized protein